MDRPAWAQSEALARASRTSSAAPRRRRPRREKAGRAAAAHRKAGGARGREPAPGDARRPRRPRKRPARSATSPCLGSSAGGEPQHLSDYQAPDNPLQIGGQLYLRAQSTAYQGDAPDRWTLNAPSLVDAYFDARPNPRVRAFILGRMSYNRRRRPRAAA